MSKIVTLVILLTSVFASIVLAGLAVLVWHDVMSLDPPPGSGRLELVCYTIDGDPVRLADYVVPLDRGGRAVFSGLSVELLDRCHRGVAVVLVTAR